MKDYIEKVDHRGEADDLKKSILGIVFCYAYRKRIIQKSQFRQKGICKLLDEANERN